MRLSKVLHIVFHLLAFPLLTLFTQIGGLVYLLFVPFRRVFKKHFPQRPKRIIVKLASFSAIYLLITFLVLPPIALKFGRVPLPLSGPVKPLNYLTAAFNRHYVKKELLDLLEDTAKRMQQKYPGTVLAYMDANFPFINGYPLIPHLSHSDGKKVDLAFLYKDPQTGETLHRQARNFIGYGGVDGPKGNEPNMPETCKSRGHWQYNLLARILPSRSEEKMELDHVRMKLFVRYLVEDKRTGKILIEPHLKQRLGLTYNKVRFHGCHAVRHDDHLHVQL